jgi:phage gpG-like protein
VSGFSIEFTPWGPFHAQKKLDEIHRWLQEVAKASEAAFRAGASAGSPPRSAPGALPGSETGGLLGSISSYATNSEAVVGSGMPYSRYLRNGTRYMARRKMSDNALQEGMRQAQLGRWVIWQRG